MTQENGQARALIEDLADGGGDEGRRDDPRGADGDVDGGRTGATARHGEAGKDGPRPVGAKGEGTGSGDASENAAGSDGADPTVDDLLSRIGDRGHAPFLIVPMLIGLSPLGGIPGVPTAMALIAVSAAVQIIAGRKGLWVPGVLKRRTLSRERLDKALEWLRPAADWLDRVLGKRLKALTRSPWRRIAAACVVLLSVTVPPSEIVPFAATPQMAAICLFGLAFLMRDGIAMLLAFAIAAGAFYTFLTLVVF